MIAISHRGNISGRNIERENTPDYITEAMDLGYYVEIDVWYINETFFLGHDEPEHEVSLKWLKQNKDFLYIHCKNVQALLELKYEFVTFFHNIDECVLMSNCPWIWTYPGMTLTEHSIAVLPERIKSWENLEQCRGICSDFISNYSS